MPAQLQQDAESPLGGLLALESGLRSRVGGPPVAYCLATVKVPLLPLLAVHVPVSRSLSTGATGVTVTPSQSRPDALKRVPDTAHFPLTLQ